MVYSLSSCLDKLPTPQVDCTSLDTIAYIEHIKPLIETKCNVSGCHATSANNGKAAIFGSTLTASRKEAIYNRVVVQLDMPIPGSGYSLTSEQVDSFRCWREGGFVQSLAPIAIPPLDCNSLTVTYWGHVKGICNRSCNTSSCHGNGSLVVMNFANITSDPVRKGIVDFITTQGIHPAGNILSQAQMDTLRCWKEGGYLQSFLICSSVSMTYDDHMERIFNTKCNTTGCHDGGINEVPVLWAQMDSTRREVVASRVADLSMPPSGDLSDAYMDSVRCWKTAGFPKN